MAPPGPRTLVVAAILLVGPAGAIRAQAPADDGPAQGPEERVTAWYTLRLGDGLRTLFLDGTTHVTRVHAPEGFEDACGTNCSADELRRIYALSPPVQRAVLVGLIEATISTRAEEALAAAAGSRTGAFVAAALDEATLDAPDDGHDAPVVATIRGFASIVGMAGEAALGRTQLDALFEMGARIKTPVAFVVDPGHDVAVGLAVAEPLGIVDPGGAVLAPDGRAAGWSLTNRAGAKPVVLSDVVMIGRLDRAVPGATASAIDVTLDLSRASADLGALADGRSPVRIDAALVLEVQIDGLQMARGLPERVFLPSLSAHALRLGIDAGLIATETVTDQAAPARDAFADVALRAFGPSAAVHGGFVDETLEVGAVPPETPIRLVLRVNGSLPAPPAAAEAGPASLVLVRQPVPLLEVPRVPVLGAADARLAIVLPPGTTFEAEHVTGGTGAIETLPDGRVAFVATGNGSETLRVEGGAIVVEPGFVWHVFGTIGVFLALGVAVAALAGSCAWRWRRPRMHPRRGADGRRLHSHRP